MSDKTKCGLCSGEVGPDITGRPMCYGCGPAEMAPKEKRREPACLWNATTRALRESDGAKRLMRMGGL